MRRALWVLALLALAPQAYGADVLFMINMNYSPQEMEAAKKAAKARGQEFVMVPPESTVKDADRVGLLRNEITRQVKRLRPDWSEARTNAFFHELMSYGSAAAEPDIRSKIGGKLDDYAKGAREMHRKELEELGLIHVQIQNKLQELKEAGKRVDSLVISAHSDGPNLTGETSYILTQLELKALKASNPEFFSDPRHVLLLGCYTNTETTNLIWRELFPGASLIAGFEGRAPLRIRPAASMFITDVLAAADQLDRANMERNEPLAEKTVRNALRKLESVRITYSAIDYCTHRVLGIPATNVRCDDQWLTLFALGQDIERMYFGYGGIPEKDPPRESSGTLLREYYNKLQTLCPIERAENIMPHQRESYKQAREIYRDRTIRLIFWWNVQGNFSTYYGKELRRLTQELKAEGIESELPALNGETGRIEMLRKIQDLYGELHKKHRALSAQIHELPPPALEASEDEKKAYQEKRNLMIEGLSRLEELGYSLSVYDPLIQLDARIPLNWVEPNVVLPPEQNQAF